MNIKIIVTTHKKYRMPEDEIYMPLHVGADISKDRDGKPLDFGYVKDNTGDNISSRNKNYCELTGLYWAWKNLEADYLGLAHYRRHFAGRGYLTRAVERPSNGRPSIDKFNAVLGSEEFKRLLRQNDVLLPRRRHYFIETNYSQYAHAHHVADLDVTRDIIAERCPEYLSAFDDSMGCTYGHRFNMFVMKRNLLNNYCSWLFDILFELERRLDISDYSDNDARVFGFVGERLLDPWLNANSIGYRDMPYIFMENQNMPAKIAGFISRKIKGCVDDKQRKRSNRP